MKLLTTVIAVCVLVILANAQGGMMPGPGVKGYAGGGTPNTFTAPTAAGNHCQAPVTSGTSSSCDISVTSGRLVIATVMSFSAPTSVTVAAGTGKDFTAFPQNPSNTNNATAGTAYGFWRVYDGTESTTVLATFNGTCAACRIEVLSFGATGGSSAPTLDVSFKGNSSGATTSVNTPTINQSVAGELFVCYGTSENGITANGSPWTLSPEGIDPGFGSATQYILASSGNQACNFTQSSGQYDTIGAAFK